MSEEQLTKWKQKLFEISSRELELRDEARRKINIERLVRDKIEQDDLLKGPEIKNHTIGH